MPLLGARGGGSVRGFGRFGKNLLLIVVDTFGRTVSGLIGTSSDGKAVWNSLRGTWAANGSAAAIASAAANRNLSTIELDGSNITNLQVDVGTSGGVGLAFWVTDANSYYSLYPSYSTSTSTSYPCNAGRENSGWGNSSGMCATTGNFTKVINFRCNSTLYYQTAYVPQSYGYVDSQTYTSQTCSGEGGVYDWPQSIVQVTLGTQTSTVVTTTYNSRVNLEKTVSGSTTSLVSSNYVSNTSGFSKAQSIAISTSGDTISYSLYSAANKGGSVISTGTNTPASPLKGLGVGLFHGPSTVDQGTTISNFKVEVTP
jgi:hypothetical protein